MTQELSGRKSSRLPEFYKLSLTERAQVVSDWAGLDDEDTAVLLHGGLDAHQAAYMIENAVGTFGLPLGIAANFLINGRDYLIPMAVEEPSVLAAVGHAAKLARAGGGFTTSSTDPIMIGQIQVLDIPDMNVAIAALEANKQRLMNEADACSQSIVKRGGGSRGIEIRPFYTAALAYLYS